MSMIIAKLYVGYSSFPDEELIVHQDEKNKEFVFQIKIDIVVECNDEAQSRASDLLFSFQKMIADTHHVDWQLVITHKMDWLSRDVADALHKRKIIKTLRTLILV